MAYLREWEKPMQMKKTEAKRGKEKRWTTHPPTILTAFAENRGSERVRKQLTLSNRRI